MQIHDHNITLKYLLKSPELRSKITNEAGVKMAINENVFKPLSQFLHKQKVVSSFNICASSTLGVIG